MTDRRIYVAPGDETRVIEDCAECGWFSDWYMMYQGPACLYKSKPRPIERTRRPHINALCKLPRVPQSDPYGPRFRKRKEAVEKANRKKP